MLLDKKVKHIVGVLLPPQLYKITKALKKNLVQNISYKAKKRIFILISATRHPKLYIPTTRY